MIIVFPMLVSRAVSENSIPGIAKTLENYIIIHKQDLIINSLNDSPQSRFFGRMFKSKNGYALKEDIDTVSISEALPPGSTPTGHKKDDQDWDKKVRDAQDRDEREKNKEEKAKLDREKFDYQQRRDTLRDIQDAEKAEKEERAAAAEKAARKATAKISTSDMKAISLEPTYITIEKTLKSGQKETIFLGVKVVPMRIKSDVKLSHLILQDTKLSSINALLIGTGRRVTKWFYRLFDKWTFRTGSLTASGDPRRDIIMGRTGMGKDSETFLVLSKQEDVDDYFLDNVNKINRLYKLGWGNFVIADDIGRVAYYCMQSFRGLCNAVPYAMMYQYLGQSKAYESMEDAKKANSSIFKIGPRFSKLIGEWKVDQKMHKYSQLNEGKTDE